MHARKTFFFIFSSEMQRCVNLQLSFMKSLLKNFIHVTWRSRRSLSFFIAGEILPGNTPQIIGTDLYKTTFSKFQHDLKFRILLYRHFSKKAITIISNL